MASLVYTPAKEQLMKATLDLDGSDIRVLLVMTNTTADTDQDAGTISAIGTLDEYDGANYARKALASEAVNRDDPNNRAEFTADPVTWTALGAGTRQAGGMVIYRHVTDDTDSVPIAYVDSGGFPFSGNGGNVVMTPNAEGLLQLT